MNSLKIKLVAVLFIALFVVTACSKVDGQSAQSAGAPDFTLEKLNGGSFNLTDTLKTKSAVLVFWTTWCPYCVEEIPDVEAFNKKYGDKASVLGINIQESKRKVQSFAEKKQIGYAIALDTTGEVADKYGIRGIPAVVAINKQGEIVYKGHDIAGVEKELGI